MGLVTEQSLREGWRKLSCPVKCHRGAVTWVFDTFQALSSSPLVLTQSRGFFLVIPLFGMSVWMWVPCLCRCQVFAIPLGFAFHSCWKC